MKTVKLTLAAAALGALVALPVASAHAWGGWGSWGSRGYNDGWVMVSAISLVTAISASICMVVAAAVVGVMAAAVVMAITMAMVAILAMHRSHRLHPQQVSNTWLSPAHALVTGGRLLYKVDTAGWQMLACFSFQHTAQLQRPQ